MQVRQTQAGDVAAIEGLVERAYVPYIDQIGVRPGPLGDDYGERVRQGNAFVAVEDEAIFGLLVLIQHADHLLVENVAVDPDRQSEGIGRGLLSFAEERAREAGTPELRLYTHARMERNCAFYLRLGFEQVDQRDEDGFERVFFSKKLGA